MEKRWQEVILDGSVFMAAILPDEESPIAEAFFAGMEDNRYHVIVPQLFFHEALNVLITALRRKRIDEEGFNEYLEFLLQFPCEVHDFSSTPKGLLLATELAHQYQLSAYDAAYLALSKHTNAPIITLDKTLSRAAENEGSLLAA